MSYTTPYEQLLMSVADSFLLRAPDDSNYDDKLRRLQLRTLVLMMKQLFGLPNIEELLEIRLADVKILMIDMNDDINASHPNIGNPGNGPHRLLSIRSGPDCNGKLVHFTACEHREPNSCPVNALADLFMFDAEEIRKALQSPSTYEKMYLFHAPGSPQKKISEATIVRDLEETLSSLGLEANSKIIFGSIEHHWIEMVGKEAASRRTLAPPLPDLPRSLITHLQQKDTVKSLELLSLIVMQSAAWKLKTFGESWPLHDHKLFRSKKAQKYFNRSMREANAELDGCANCGLKDSEDRKLLKCTGCKTTVYCGRKCQRAHWSLHKPECKRLMPKVKKNKA